MLNCPCPSFYATSVAQLEKNDATQQGNEMHSSVYGNTRWFIIIIFIIVMRRGGASPRSALLSVLLRHDTYTYNSSGGEQIQPYAQKSAHAHFSKERG